MRQYSGLIARGHNFYVRVGLPRKYWLLAKCTEIGYSLHTGSTELAVRRWRYENYHIQKFINVFNDVTLVDYLLEKGANPNYLDYRGWSAFDYAYFNKALFAPQLICLSLERYQDKFPKEDATERRRQILDWALNQNI